MTRNPVSGGPAEPFPAGPVRDAVTPGAPSATPEPHRADSGALGAAETRAAIRVPEAAVRAAIDAYPVDPGVPFDERMRLALVAALGHLAAELARLRAALDRVRALHRETEGRCGHCSHLGCQVTHPCATIRALDGTDQRETTR